MCSQFGCVESAHQLDLKLIESGAFSGITNGDLQFMVISEKDKFTEVYSKIRSLELPRPPIPEINFDKYRVLVALMGQKSTAGYGISFDNLVLQRDNEIEIKVIFNLPPPDSVLATVVTRPYVIASIGKGSYERVKFVNEEGEILNLLDVR
ncbi:protease complex subunit PrcB family protein [Desulfobacterota bacterium AH_259_B03_O07]|nr:protease complex subunit PrcB family protein [Desulfobacterota bacterium AH_259_B03_O07]